jgi:UDP-N-acetylmuramoyl-tripeptide--D-alanyl-D-alanine ligase
VTTAVGLLVLTAELVADAGGGRLVAGSPDRVCHSVSIDTRTLEPGALFIALRGERFDGHDFVDEALRQGAAAVLVSRPPDRPDSAAVIVVDDTLRALHDLARAVRRRSGTQVVAITGSAGKTTTKEITAAFLSARYRVFRNHGNLNNHIGLPLSLLELRHAPEIAVVELGMNHPGEIRTLIGIAEPDVRVWTNVGDAHIGYFGSRDAVARAKAEVLEGATDATRLVANADDPLVMAHARGFPGRVITFGERQGADVRATDVVDRGVDGTECVVDTSAGRLAIAVSLPGRAQLQNVLAAVAVALEFGVPPAAIEARAGDLAPVRRRGAVTTLGSGVRVVDDSYNASPAAVRSMLLALAATRTTGRRIAVLGEMLELGDQARALHEECGAIAAGASIDELVAVGGAAAEGFVAGAVAAGLPAGRAHRYASSADAADAVARLVRPGDLVLIKGSRGTRTDVIVDRLVQDGGPQPGPPDDGGER